MCAEIEETTFASQLNASLTCFAERDFFIDNLLVQIHSIIEMILVDRPCAVAY